MTHRARAPIDVRLTPEAAAESFASDIRAGLSTPPRSIPPKWLYDPLGCELFETITTLDEYYPTRAEDAALDARADEIAALTGATTLVELGSGTSTKTRRLLDALVGRGTLERFCAFDVAEPTLRHALESLGTAYPGLALSGVVGDFERHLDALPGEAGRLVLLLGGTIGNLEPDRRRVLLAALAEVLQPGEHFLVGTDLVKDPARLVAAYDDSKGVTARFERNILTVVNAVLNADFDPNAFDYVARWEPIAERIEMGLRSRRPHHVTVADLGMVVDLEPGEEIRTEISTKFHLDGIAAELDKAGFDPVGAWTDPDGDFALTLARRR